MTVGATHILQAADVETSATVQLIYDVRMLRRKLLRALQDEAFLVDLPHTTCVNAGDALVLKDGRFVAVAAADAHNR